MLKPYYDKDRIRIYHGDAEKVLKAIGPAVADIAFCDPPYPMKDRPWIPRETLNACLEASRKGAIVMGVPLTGSILAFNSLGPTQMRLWIPSLKAAQVEQFGGHVQVPIWFWGHFMNMPCVFEDAFVGNQGEQKPISLMARLIGRHSVIDPFMGSGSTLIAAKQAGVFAIGIDNDLLKCKRAVEALDRPMPVNIFKGRARNFSKE